MTLVNQKFHYFFIPLLTNSWIYLGKYLLHKANFNQTELIVYLIVYFCSLHQNIIWESSDGFPRWKTIKLISTNFLPHFGTFHPLISANFVKVIWNFPRRCALLSNVNSLLEYSRLLSTDKAIQKYTVKKCLENFPKFHRKNISGQLSFRTPANSCLCTSSGKIVYKIFSQTFCTTTLTLKAVTFFITEDWKSLNFLGKYFFFLLS